MKTKFQRARIEIINRELTKHKYVKTTNLVKQISEEVVPVNVRTVQKDIELMKEQWPMGFDAPIEYNSIKKAYYYSDSNFTINKLGLRADDMIALLFYAKTLQQYKNILIFEDIIKAIDKVLGNYDITPKTKELVANRTILQLEKVPLVRGIEYIEPILKAVVKEVKIVIEYKKHDAAEPIKRILAPLLIKESKNYWYVLGIVEGTSQMRTYALDRIIKLDVTEEYFTPPIIDFSSYFQHSLGITVPNDKPILIKLSFTPLQGNYIKALPLHETQTILKDNAKELLIAIKVQPSYELYSKILSFGQDLKIISPRSVEEEVKNQLKMALKRYK